jgi:hypothetical protein
MKPYVNYKSLKRSIRDRMKDVEILDPKRGAFPCNHISLEMNYPRSKGDIESFLWYLYHEGVEVIIGNDGEWYIVVKGKCKQLKRGRCLIADRQPVQCLQHGDVPRSIKSISRFHFKTELDILVYLKEKRPALFKKLHAKTRKIAVTGKAVAKPKTAKGKKFVLDGEHECSSCDTCCTYLNIVADRPTDEEDVNELLWYINHKNCEINHDEDGGWSILFRTACELLGRNGLCGIYERRPTVCKTFSSNNCHGNEFDNSVKMKFPTEKSLLAYLSKKRPGLFKKLSPKIKKAAKTG